jgi:sugar/nucleoside kinase (ribokinase family)
MRNLEFKTVVGTGGIGSGLIFHLESNRALDRNESRPAILTDIKDYCKQHIILHYIAKILAPDVKVHAIGLVGNDDQGSRMLSEMQSAGIKIDAVGICRNLPTTVSVCLKYPDGSVCNVTSSNGASSEVSSGYIRRSVSDLQLEMDGYTAVIAAPEVPIDARLELLKAGRNGGAFCIASLTGDEADDFKKSGGFLLCDLLSINEAEAEAIAGVRNRKTEDLANACYRFLYDINPDIMLIITCGRKGSYSFFRGQSECIQPLPTEVVSSAGAGDAYIAGVVCGLALGLPFQYGAGGCGGKRATDLGSYFAGISVASKDTIAESIDKALIDDYLKG